MVKVNKEILKDLRVMFIGMAILNVFVFVVSLLWKFSFLFLFSLLIGYAYMCFNLFFLGWTVSVSVSKSTSSAKRYMYGSYLIRYSILAMLAGISFKTSYLNPIGIILPLFYPKIVLGWISIKGRR